ncbi:unnamed protein product [Parnassius mnemosyne]|uniref:Uncharacterized protein n=1 Tax=Parnassius mnemosyne TaxID=213953 RepID=A0AAV1LNI4_9NEOP
MLLKFTLITILTYNVFASNELESLHGINGGNRVTLCMDPGIEKYECEGVIWQRNWVLVKGSCVADKALYPVIVLRTSSAACDSIVTDIDVSGSRRVRARFMHPSYPATDIALLYLDRPYDVPEPLRNDSSAILYKLEPWLTDTSVFPNYPQDTAQCSSKNSVPYKSLHNKEESNFA